MTRYYTYLNKVSRAVNLFLAAARPCQFGFIQSHVHFDDEKLNHIRTVLESGDDTLKQQVVFEYEKKFALLVGDGYATSFASARMAFYTLMKALDIGKDDEVILPAFTCAVMPNAVMRTGARPVYAEIDKYTFGSSASAIEKAITARTKMIVAQHSFGIPCDIDKIASLAKNKGIFLVEDCAISLDSSFMGIPVGNWGNAAIFSTDHGKPLNTMIGGILYLRDSEMHYKVSRLARNNPPLALKHQQQLYKRLLYERKYFVPNRYPRAKLYDQLRSFFARLIGRPHTIYLESDYSRPRPDDQRYPYPAAMPAFLARLGIYEIERWSEEKANRKKMLTYYLESLEQSVYKTSIPAVYKDSQRAITPLRFVFTPRDPEGRLLQRLSRHFDIDWMWFRLPVICAVDGLESLDYYYGSCPASEKICSDIINLPCNVFRGWENEVLKAVHCAMQQHA